MFVLLECGMPETPVTHKIGPAWRYAIRTVFFNPLTFPATFFVAFAFTPAVREICYEAVAAHPGIGRTLLVWFYHFQKTVHLGYISSFGLGLLVGFALLRQVTTSYTISGDYIYIQEGIIGRSTNTVAKGLIFDCDIKQGFSQIIFGTGDLILRTVDHQVIRLRFVPEPAKWRDAIMSGSSVTDTRLLGTI